MERAVSPECNEILVSKKFKERMQKPGDNHCFYHRFDTVSEKV